MEKKNRLISADVAKEMIISHANEFSDVLNRREKALLIGGGTSCIDKCPTVDAVEIVKCKNCKHYIKSEENVGGHCREHCMWTNTDDFCSYGERKDNGM